MNNLINPYDLGINNPVSENCQKIQIDEIIRQASRNIKGQILQLQIEAVGFKLNLLTSKTRFNGTRYWFSCPICSRRVGIIYKHPMNNQIGCRECLGIKYKKQRYKGMIEGK